MSHTDEYEYENELAIDSKLICAICLLPYMKPKSTLCNHIFCRNCIELWHEKSLTCPLCRDISSNKHIKTVRNVDLLTKLNQLKVKCLLCEQTGIERKDFESHRNNFCSKQHNTHSLDQMKDLWKDFRDDHQSRIPFKSTYSRRRRLTHIINQFPLNSKITLRNYQLTDSDMSIVVHYAIKKRQCRILDLGANQIVSYGIIHLADSLEKNRKLKLLSLHQNSISEKSIKYLTNKLSTKRSYLKWLDLESTDLNDHSAEYLAEMLATNQSITGLWLSNNRIGYRGVMLLTSILKSSNTTLKHLDLENNPSIDDSCLDYVMDMLKENQTLKTVYLNQCQLSMISKRKLREIANTKANFHLYL
ncbi:hypothetical protein I4U23_020230 [Adineta vaga]|nr:hypothetical protein I4U23_020230 [Adineta vaga]